MSDMRNCPRCLNTAVIADGYCGHCRECTLPPTGILASPDPVGLIASLQKQVETLNKTVIELSEGMEKKVKQVEQLREALQSIVLTWDGQCGRVFESMGVENPRALAIDAAIVRASESLEQTKP